MTHSSSTVASGTATWKRLCIYTTSSVLITSRYVRMFLILCRVAEFNIKGCFGYTMSETAHVVNQFCYYVNICNIPTSIYRQLDTTQLSNQYCMIIELKHPYLNHPDYHVLCSICRLRPNISFIKHACFVLKNEKLRRDILKNNFDANTLLQLGIDTQTFNEATLVERL